MVTSQSEPSFNLHGVKVLVVDDANTRDFLIYLQQCGASAIAVASASETLDTLQFKPNILLSGIGMPEVDGYMLMQQVRIPKEMGGQVKAITLTAYAREYNQQQALAVGYNMHLAKPTQPE